MEVVHTIVAIAEAAAKLFDAIAWPISVVVLLVLVVRKQHAAVQRLIDRVKSVAVPGVQVDLAEKLGEEQESAAESGTESLAAIHTATMAPPARITPNRLPGVVLDTGTIVDLVTRRSRSAAALLMLALEHACVVALPAAALAEAHAQVDAGGRARLHVLTIMYVTIVYPFGHASVGPVTDLLARAPRADLAAAQAAHISSQRDWPVVTTRSDVLHSITTKIKIEALS